MTTTTTTTTTATTADTRKIVSQCVQLIRTGQTTLDRLEAMESAGRVASGIVAKVRAELAGAKAPNSPAADPLASLLADLTVDAKPLAEITVSAAGKPFITITFRNVRSGNWLAPEIARELLPADPAADNPLHSQVRELLADIDAAGPRLQSAINAANDKASAKTARAESRSTTRGRRK